MDAVAGKLASGDVFQPDLQKEAECLRRHAQGRRHRFRLFHQVICGGWRPAQVIDGVQVELVQEFPFPGAFVFSRFAALDGCRACKAGLSSGL